MVGIEWRLQRKTNLGDGGFFVFGNRLLATPWRWGRGELWELSGQCCAIPNVGRAFWGSWWHFLTMWWTCGNMSHRSCFKGSIWQDLVCWLDGASKLLAREVEFGRGVGWAPVVARGLVWLRRWWVVLRRLEYAFIERSDEGSTWA